MIFQKKFKIVLLVFFIILVISGWFAFRNLALWLVVSDPVPQSLDAIFTFAGENNRITYSKKLFTAYPHAVWINSYPSMKISIPLAKEGLDTSRILIIDTCKNTSSEVAYITSWARGIVSGNRSLPASCSHQGGFSEKKPLRIGLVSAPFHMRRISVALSKTKKVTGCTLYFLPVPFEQYGEARNNYKNWWSNKYLAPEIVLELKKLAYYLFKS